MFWSKERTVRVELLSPPVVVTSTAPTPPNTTQEPKGSTSPLSLDQFLKLAAIMVAVVNTALVVMGYMRYVGLMQQFGISRTEVAFSLPDLLSFGYVSFLNMTLSGQVAVATVTSVITLPVMPIVVRFKKNMHAVLQYLLVWAIATGLFFLVTGPYWFAFNPGKEAALKAAAESLGVDAELQGLEKEQEVTTENGSLTGEIILAMPDITYLLKEGVLYKIRASDGKVLRRTHLKAKLAETQKAEPKPANSSTH
ncbi:hypothetical protein [Pseudomonas aeruginosa]|uniref:hypothetical protein n=1 Tax=Pseudomonas aeruginosa TaxID=287 RepID=UPI001A2E14FC|nr:hypothetical protein [Pseudomonas aeruginosa]MBH3820601.1 hypothetical protein [Pseudomonas aeruginosa]MBW0903440.1 hypothetical protein [Pseudomonas aeruginosa]MCS7693305.1 hypothetical protein [Pseudomonas aeruginosa]MDE9747883.1 hypothetical protein [Pseudomonas aeruginosa]HBO3166666.1 hypothetical protein [Pseudomonas aeruginosa]